jgi:hypothetical protein
MLSQRWSYTHRTDLTYFAECVEDCIAVRFPSYKGHPLHLQYSSRGRRHNIYEAMDKRRERSQSYDDKRAIDDRDTLSWFLEGLTLLGYSPDVDNNLSRCDYSSDWYSASHSEGDDSAESNHFVVANGKIFEKDTRVIYKSNGMD